MLKSITAKELFKKFPEIKAKLWGGKFRTRGFYANTVGQYAHEEVIKAYVKNQVTKKDRVQKNTHKSTNTILTPRSLCVGVVHLEKYDKKK